MKITFQLQWLFGLSDDCGPVEFAEYQIHPAPPDGTGKLEAVAWQLMSNEWECALYRIESDESLAVIATIPSPVSQLIYAKAWAAMAIQNEVAWLDSKPQGAV